MGDLKKRKMDYVVKNDNEKEIVVEMANPPTEKESIELFRTYIKKFYETQKEKQKKGEDLKHGKVSDV